MISKKKMATTKKSTKITGKFVEFFSAISGFWPVWLSVMIIVVVFFGFEHYNKLDKLEIQQVVINHQPVVITTQIKVEGILKYINKEIIKEVVLKKLEHGYLASDLDEIREAVENEAWVKRATIKRLPPDILLVNITEQVVMLRWKDKALISQQGELFSPESMDQFNGLAMIDSEKESIQQALSFLMDSVPVLKEIELKLKFITEDKLGGWEITTVQGSVLKFGRKKLQHRLKLLKKLWPSALQKGAINTFDLRYTNGAAVSYLEANG